MMLRACALLLLACSPLVISAAASNKKPNVLLIFTDDMSVQLSAGGGEMSVMTNVTNLIAHQGASACPQPVYRHACGAG